MESCIVVVLNEHLDEHFADTVFVDLLAFFTAFFHDGLLIKNNSCLQFKH